MKKIVGNNNFPDQHKPIIRKQFTRVNNRIGFGIEPDSILALLIAG